MKYKYKIPFYNVSRIYSRYKSEIHALSDNIYSKGMVLESNDVNELEEYLASICNRKYALMLKSCSDALFFSLLAANIKEGDEVLIPAYSFIASATPVIRAGATPVFVDTDIFGNIDLEKASLKINNKTKAIIPVHLFGNMLNVSDLLSFANKHNIIIIEDAAQALGSSYNGIPAGKTGLCSCFSFDPSKIVGAFGTGGAMLCDDENIYKYVKSIRGQGQNPNSKLFESIGYNSRISSVQAALILLQLKEISKIVISRQEIANHYILKLRELPLKININTNNNIVWNYHKFPIFTEKRDELKLFLDKKGIESGIHYKYILPNQPVFNIKEQDFKVAAKLSETELSLPIYPELNNSEINYISKSIIEFFNTK